MVYTVIVVVCRIRQLSRGADATLTAVMTASDALVYGVVAKFGGKMEREVVYIKVCLGSEWPSQEHCDYGQGHVDRQRLPTSLTRSGYTRHSPSACDVR